MFFGDGSEGTFFRFIGEVEVFEGFEVGGVLDILFELWGKFALGADSFEDSFSSFFEGFKGLVFFVDFADLFFVEGSGSFFSVSGDEGDGVAFFEELDGSFDLLWLELELGSDGGEVHGFRLL